MVYMKPQVVQIQSVGIKTLPALYTQVIQFLYVVGGFYYGTEAGIFAFRSWGGKPDIAGSFHVILVP